MNSDFWRDIEPEELRRQAAADENCRFVLKVMKTLTCDEKWTKPIVEAVEAGRVETRCFVSWLAREMQPKNYLEVGVRRGFSMAMVAARAPEAEIFGFDMWMKDYAGVENPGAAFVKSELRKIGYEKKIHLIEGDSHQTLPAFFGAPNASLKNRLKLALTARMRPADFDLVVIDGDHSLLGAYADLLDAMPHCAVGGAVVFDDILPGALGKIEGEADPRGWRDLLGVWRAVREEFPDFRFFEFLADMPGVGLAVRMK